MGRPKGSKNKAIPKEQIEQNVKSAVLEKIEKKENNAYVTLLASNDFMPGLIVCLLSYGRVKKDIPMYVMCTDNISEDNRKIITALGGNILSVPDITIYGAEKGAYLRQPTSNKIVHICMPKLNIFRLTDFTKIVYVDADMIFMHNCDELFYMPHMSAVKDWSYGQFNAGLLVVEPNLDTFKLLIDTLSAQTENQDSFDINDQDVLYSIYPHWPEKEELHLPKGYNFQIFGLTNCGIDILLPLFDVKILHMMGLSKPWITPSHAYFEYNGGPVFAAAMELYVKMINDAIKIINQNGLSSEDLQLINLDEKRLVFGAVYPREI